MKKRRSILVCPDVIFSSSMIVLSISPPTRSRCISITTSGPRSRQSAPVQLSRITDPVPRRRPSAHAPTPHDRHHHPRPPTTCRHTPSRPISTNPTPLVFLSTASTPLFSPADPLPLVEFPTGVPHPRNKTVASQQRVTGLAVGSTSNRGSTCSPAVRLLMRR